jgi:predicted RNA-binding Zn ribbon-like protein
MTLPSWVPAIETKPAPSPLLLVQAFVNTYEADADTDLLVDPRSARRWLHSCGLLDRSAKLDFPQLGWICNLREAIRALLQENAGHPGPTRAQERLLATVADRAAMRLTITRGTQRLSIEPDSADPLDTMIVRLLLIVRDAQHDGSWSRLKTCSNPDCRWAYYDRSHAGKGKWCDMSGCGNRMKNRALRARRTDGQS